MARPIKQGVDYFPHDIDATNRKTLTTLETMFGNDGYAFWFKLLELLGSKEGLHIDCNDETEWLFLVAKTRVSEVSAAEILNTLARLGAIDRDLWQNRIIWVQNFVDRLMDVYKKRKQELPAKPIIDNSFRSENPGAADVSGAISTQSKVNKSKLNKSNKTFCASDDARAADLKTLFAEFWAVYPKKKSKGEAEKAWKTIKPSKELVAIMLEKLAQAKTCEDWTKEGGQYIPYPATWLRAKGWEDELTPVIDIGMSPEYVAELERKYGGNSDDNA